MDSNLHSIARKLFDFDGTPCKPHDRAIIRTLSLFSEASQQLPYGLPRATVTSDVVGNVYILWRNGQRNLHVIVPPEKAKPVVLSHNDFTKDRNYGTEMVNSARFLAEWLSWFALKSIPCVKVERAETIADFLEDTDLLSLLLWECI